MIDRRIHTLLRNDTPPTPTLQSHCRQQPIPPIAPLRSMSHLEPCDPERPYCSCSSYCLDNVRPVQTVTTSPPSGCLIILLTLVSGHLIGMTPTTCEPQYSHSRCGRWHRKECDNEQSGSTKTLEPAREDARLVSSFEWACSMCFMYLHRQAIASVYFITKIHHELLIRMYISLVQANPCSFFSERERERDGSSYCLPNIKIKGY